jgi:hypothetical protein
MPVRSRLIRSEKDAKSCFFAFNFAYLSQGGLSTWELLPVSYSQAIRHFVRLGLFAISAPLSFYKEFPFLLGLQFR